MRRKTSADSRTRPTGMCASTSLQPRNTGVPSKRPRYVARRARRADQSAAQPDDGGVAAGVTGRELERQAGTLGKSEQRDARLRNTLRRDLRDQPRDACPGLT